MKKTIALLLCLILCAFAVVGCSSESPYVGKWTCTSMEISGIIIDGEIPNSMTVTFDSDGTGEMAVEGEGSTGFTWEEVSGGVKIDDTYEVYTFNYEDGKLVWDFDGTIFTYEQL